MPETTTLALRGVRVHNLKNIDVAIPLGRLTVVTGVCGAGKSSLVFDTLYAEAQRRYLQSFSAYTRQFLERFDQPDAEEIGDLLPAVAIRGGVRSSPRATVASLTDIAAPLRLVFARAGAIVCPHCDRPVIAHRAEDVLAAIESLPAGTRCAIAFPMAPGESADQPPLLASLLEEGYFRIQADGVLYRLGEQAIPELPGDRDIWVLLDRFEIGKTPRERLMESVDAGFRRGQGRLGVLTDAKEHVFDQRHVCAGCGHVFLTPTPRLFDANDSLGACPACHGTGMTGKDANPCAACEGRRWNADALAVRVGGRTIADWHALPIVDLRAFVQALDLPDDARLPIEQIRARLDTLASLDLGYLTLAQPAATLSDGPTRRVALAAALASNLVNVLFLLDEPSVGLHPRDALKLRDALLRLRDRGNTVVVIEHERAIIEAADHVIDLGPGAGEEGGEVVYQGPPVGLGSAERVIETPTERRKPTGFLTLRGASVNNLQDLTVEFPLGVLCAITGVSGAGKRSLIEKCLYPALCVAKKKKDGDSSSAQISGAGKIADVILLDRAPPAKSSRSNPATYLKIFDEIRTLFAETVDAKIRNFGPGHFSFNQPAGRCETCEGQGTLAIDMQFLADVTATCPECQGRRYRKEILDIKVRSRSIAEVLDLTVREAFRFFRAQPAIEKKLKVLIDVGLDYLRLGQSVETLAGGECQRLKLAAHLASSRKAGCLFLLIEPSAGLHPDDVANLLDCFERLLVAGHSLIAIEHDLDVIRSCDYVIDLDGGRVVAQGTPEEVAAVGGSPTGEAIRTAE